MMHGMNAKVYCTITNETNTLPMTDRLTKEKGHLEEARVLTS